MVSKSEGVRLTNMRSYWGAGAIGVLLVMCCNPAGADDKASTVSAIGTGTFSCEKFNKYDVAPNNANQMGLIVQWAWGFISAYNLRAAFNATYQESDAPSPVTPPDAAGTLGYLRKFCQKNPQSNLTTATIYLIGAAGGIVSSTVELPRS
jgi:hypothetical protein